MWKKKRPKMRAPEEPVYDLSRAPVRQGRTERRKRSIFDICEDSEHRPTLYHGCAVRSYTGSERARECCPCSQALEARLCAPRPNDSRPVGHSSESRGGRAESARADFSRRRSRPRARPAARLSLRQSPYSCASVHREYGAAPPRLSRKKRSHGYRKALPAFWIAYADTNGLASSMTQSPERPLLKPWAEMCVACARSESGSAPKATQHRPCPVATAPIQPNGVNSAEKTSGAECMEAVMILGMSE